MGFFNTIRADPGFVSPVRSDPGLVSPIRSDPIRSDPGFVNGRSYPSRALLNYDPLSSLGHNLRSLPCIALCIPTAHDLLRH